MARHLAACAPARDVGDASPATLIRLHIEAQGDRRYWLDLDMNAAAPLRALDRFLRDVWLECCGHMSAFTIHGVRYDTSRAPDWSFDTLSSPPRRSMNAKLGEVVSPGRVFHHEYDFGTTTALKLRVAGARDGRIGRRPVRLLARNEPLRWMCAVCDAAATDICVLCADERDDIFFCADHARAHRADEHEDDDAMLPVVNSPRMGVCGYTGPRTTRYEVPQVRSRVAWRREAPPPGPTR